VHGGDEKWWLDGLHSSDNVILRIQVTKPPIVSEVTFNPIDSGRQEEKNGEAG
jgi:hypothetical protein